MIYNDQVEAGHARQMAEERIKRDGQCAIMNFRRMHELQQPLALKAKLHFRQIGRAILIIVGDTHERPVAAHSRRRQKQRQQRNRDQHAAGNHQPAPLIARNHKWLVYTGGRTIALCAIGIH